ncbi:MAG: YggW family oxidoreductase [Legionellales bacterium RIFCSPHIGHO2_12_FULL_37_14]|nr:MAG: YggW family oxidoreductase [Legionellales bacterium RIFCSPHIGHO2_12_FULL_37_14]
MRTPIPTSLYIHIPWCIKKCPYCDFNSHEINGSLPEENYINALIEDFKHDISLFKPRLIDTIFIGGGTPSLFKGESYAKLFAELQKLVTFSDDIEITLEANPATVELIYLAEYCKLGINRLSLGVQSFNDNLLKKIGRIHSSSEALAAIKAAKNAGFTNINIDLMYGIPEQTLQDGIKDIEIALNLPITHLSWYQFTIEKNTYFSKYPPVSMPEDIAENLEKLAFKLLKNANFKRYEISAFARENALAKHNMNYWTFGDYFGIGAGAHGKLTDPNTKKIFRTQKTRLPKSYLNQEAPKLIETKILSSQDLIFEYMLNATRLEGEIPFSLFKERTFLDIALLNKALVKAVKKNLLKLTTNGFIVTDLGRRFTNNLQMEFLT